jgi:putative mycofactocin binding protein MftB
MAIRYKLARGTQVREEDFGLLFYTQAGPRLYFLPSGELLPPTFFGGQETLDQWLENSGGQSGASAGRIRSLKTALSDLFQKGVIIEF